MKINISQKDEKYIELDFSGEGHTLLNLLQTNLLEVEEVEMAGYSKQHPLMDRSKLFIRLKKEGDHLEVLKKAAIRADGKLDEFLSKFEKSLQDFK
jgi:DNA-directed RNA polymerase subunit L